MAQAPSDASDKSEKVTMTSSDYTKEELDRLSLFLKYCLDEDLDWVNCKHNDTIEIKYRYDSTSGVGIARGVTEIHVPPEEFWKGFEKWDLVKTFDPMYGTCIILSVAVNRTLLCEIRTHTYHIMSHCIPVLHIGTSGANPLN